MTNHPKVRGLEPYAHPVILLQTCGVITAGSRIVLCACGCVRETGKPHAFLAELTKGWVCPKSECGVFNGEEKERRETCRTCEAKRPDPSEED